MTDVFDVILEWACYWRKTSHLSVEQIRDLSIKINMSISDQHEAEVRKLTEAIDDLISLAVRVMAIANCDGAEYDFAAELADARALISTHKEAKP